MLAWQARQLWEQCPKYWRSFKGVTNKSGESSRHYGNLSWKQSLDIIRIFNGLPSDDEIEVFLSHEFDAWFESNHMRTTFPVFIKYLKYRTQDTTGWLSPSEERSFDQSQRAKFENEDEFFPLEKAGEQSFFVSGFDLSD